MSIVVWLSRGPMIRSICMLSLLAGELILKGFWVSEGVGTWTALLAIWLLGGGMWDKCYAVRFVAM